MDIKQQDPLSDSQNETVLFFKDVTNSDDMLLSNDYSLTIKTEVKSEDALPDFNSQNQGEFLSDDPVMNVKKYNCDHEMYSKVEIKEEPCWLETVTSSALGDIGDGDLLPVKSPRLCTEAVPADSGKSSLHSAEGPGKDTGFYNGMDHPECENQESDVMEVPTLKDQMPSEQSGALGDGDEIYSNASLHLKEKNFIHEGQRSHKCGICAKGFSRLSNLNKHYLIHKGKKPHKCEICEKRFTELSTLKRHKLTHDSERPHKCAICEKGFTQFSHLKRHNLIHKGKKPHKCEICDRSFTQLTNLKRHSLIHEDHKQHKCKICEKGFTQLSYLEIHNLIHEGKKPHKCEICKRSFTQLSHLKRHNSIHVGKNHTI